MSRSYRKPYHTEGYGGGRRKHSKRQANKAVRNAEDPPAKGKAYRKEYDPWAIRDWSFHDPKNKKVSRK